MTLRELVNRATSTKYTRALEAEVGRLRGENRALLNSILGIAGVPPIVVADNDVSPMAGSKAVTAAGRVATSANAANASVRLKRVVPGGVPGSAADQKIVTPMRRRSWHQIYRMLEINSARKKESSEIL